MASITHARRRSASVLAIAVLLLALVLSSCAGRGVARGNTTPGGSGNIPTQTTGNTGGNSAALNADISALSSTDVQVQSALTVADDQQAAANQDLSGQDSDTTP